MLIAQHHKDRKHFRIMDNTQEVLNAKFRLKFSYSQDINRLLQKSPLVVSTRVENIASKQVQRMLAFFAEREQ